MLHNPKWDKKVKADPLDPSTLVLWLERQPAAQRYDYNAPCGCLLAQYFGEHGMNDPIISTVCISSGYTRDPVRDLPPAFNRIAAQRPWTFGAAAKRARAEFA